MKNTVISDSGISLNPPLRVLSSALGREFATEENLIFPRPNLKRAITRDQVVRYFEKQAEADRSLLD